MRVSWSSWATDRCGGRRWRNVPLWVLTRSAWSCCVKAGCSEEGKVKAGALLWGRSFDNVERIPFWRKFLSTFCGKDVWEECSATWTEGTDRTFAVGLRKTTESLDRVDFKNTDRERERERKESEEEEYSKRHFYMQGGKKNHLLGGSQALPSRPSGSSSIRIKIYVEHPTLVTEVAWNRGRGHFSFSVMLKHAIWKINIIIFCFKARALVLIMRNIEVTLSQFPVSAARKLCHIASAVVTKTFCCLCWRDRKTLILHCRVRGLRTACC